MKLSRLIIAVTFLLISQLSFAQINKSDLIKTWKAYQIQEGKSKPQTVPNEMKNDFLKFNENGTYESLEYGQFSIKGTWIYDVTTNNLTLKQTVNKNFPPIIKGKILKLNQNEFVFEAKDIEGNILVVYSKPTN